MFICLKLGQEMQVFYEYAKGQASWNNGFVYRVVFLCEIMPRELKPTSLLENFLDHLNNKVQL